MNNAIKLLEAIGQIQDAYIIEAHADAPKSASPGKRFLLIAAIAAAVLLLAGCGALAWHWYSTFFTLQRDEPLSQSQVAYINENAGDLHESQTRGGYTVELKSALAESRNAYITLGIRAPEDVDFMNLKDGENLLFDLFAVPEGSQLPALTSYQIVDDGDGKNNTVNVVLSIGSGEFQPEASFGPGSSWRIVLRKIVVDCWDREYEQELLRTKYAGVTDFMFADEEVAKMHSQRLLSSERWEFDVRLTSADTDSLELLTAPISTKVVVSRKDRSDSMFYETKEAVEAVTVTSIRLHSLGAVVDFEPPEAKEDSPYPDFHCACFYRGQVYDSSSSSPEERFFVVLRDGTRIDFRQAEWATDEANLTSDSPIVLKDVDYLQLPDGTRLYPPKP